MVQEHNKQTARKMNAQSSGYQQKKLSPNGSCNMDSVHKMLITLYCNPVPLSNYEDLLEIGLYRESQARDLMS